MLSDDGTGGPGGSDPLESRVLSELETFTDWLRENEVRGFIGEVGWPDGPEAQRWNGLAERWFRAADAARLWVTTWSTGEWWGDSYPLAVYEDRDDPAGIDSRNTQATVVEAHLGGRGYRRGINVAGGEFAAPNVQPTDPFSNENPGVYGTDYHFDRRASFRYLAERGVELVRIPFRWERLQPRLGGSLDRAERRRLKRVIRRARAEGLKVILDMHNYGAYYLHRGDAGVRSPIGSPDVKLWHFANVWRRIAERFGGMRGVIGYGLMNEPVDMAASPDRSPAELWERASQRALDAIRSKDMKTRVMVAGYLWSGAQRWTEQHPDPWITDPADRFFYEAHHYFDRDNSGTYQHSYDEELKDAESRS